MTQLLSARDIAAQASVTERTARTWMKDELPVVRFGPKWVRVRSEDFEAFIERRAAAAI